MVAEHGRGAVLPPDHVPFSCADSFPDLLRFSRGARSTVPAGWILSRNEHSVVALRGSLLLDARRQAASFSGCFGSMQPAKTVLSCLLRSSMVLRGVGQVRTRVPHTPTLAKRCNVAVPEMCRDDVHKSPSASWLSEALCDHQGIHFRAGGTCL